MDPVGRCWRFAVGQEACLSRTITRADIEAYAQLSGDVNPLHLDEEFAAMTRFGGCIAHGMLVAGLIAAVLGNELPGPGAVYVKQELRFRAPVMPGDRVTARVTVRAWDETSGRIRLDTVVVRDDDVTAISGAAVLVMADCLG